MMNLPIGEFRPSFGRGGRVCPGIGWFAGDRDLCRQTERSLKSYISQEGLYSTTGSATQAETKL